MRNVTQALTSVERYGNPTLPDNGLVTGVDNQPITTNNDSPVTTNNDHPSRMFNVLLTRKARKQNMESWSFAVIVPEEEDEHQYIRTYVRTNHFGWTIAGYAPRIQTPSEDAAGEP